MVALHRQKLGEISAVRRSGPVHSDLRQSFGTKHVIQAFLQDLRRPEYVHVLLNPVPGYGLAMGLIGTAIALLLRSRRAHVVGLSLIFLATATAWPVYELGQKSSDAVSVIADDDGRAWLKAHEHRAEKLIPLFYVLAILSATAIVVPLKIPRASLP